MIEVIDKADKDFIILTILKILPDIEILAYGSRINNTASKHSDLDIALKSNTNIPFSKLALIDEIFENSNLKYKINIVNYNNLNAEFKSIVDKTSTKW